MKLHIGKSGDQDDMKATDKLNVGKEAGKCTVKKSAIENAPLADAEEETNAESGCDEDGVSEETSSFIKNSSSSLSGCDSNESDDESLWRSDDEDSKCSSNIEK